MVLAVLATLLSLFAVGIFVLQVWPPRLLLLTETEASALPIEARLTAETAMRNSILSAVGGIIAAGVAFAALRQASLARRVHAHQKNIDWSKAFSDASKMLSDNNPTYSVAGVVGLRALIEPQATDSTTELIKSTLASFIRNATGRNEDAVRLALQSICEHRDQKGYSLRGAHLANMNLADFSFEGLDLAGASFRGSSLSARQKDLISSFQGVDLGDVTWTSG